MNLFNSIKTFKAPLVLFFVVDCSGSMAGQKIGTVNSVMFETIPELPGIAVDNPEVSLKVATLGFATGAEWITGKQPVTVNEDFRWTGLEACGVTDLGEALRELDDKLSDRNFMGISNNNNDNNNRVKYAPVIFLISDGEPTDNYKDALEKLKNNKLFERSVKVALAIGNNANVDILSDFTGNRDTVVSVDDNTDLGVWIKFIVVKSTEVASQTDKVNGILGTSNDKNKEIGEEIKAEEKRKSASADSAVEASGLFDKESF